MGQILLPQSRYAFSPESPIALAAGYEFGYRANWYIDTSFGGKFKNGGKSTLGTTITSKAGPALTSGFGFGVGVPNPCIPDVWNSTGKTLHIYFQITSLANPQPVVSKYTFGPTYWQIAVTSAGAIFFGTNGLASGNSIPLSSSGVISAGSNWYLASVVFEKSGTQRLYVNGIQVATGTCGTLTASDSGLQLTPCYGYISGSAVAADSTKFGMMAVCSHAQSAGEILDLVSNPFKVFKAPVRDMRFAIDTQGIISAPGSDLVTSGWTATPGAGFYTMVNEWVQDDANYITSPFAGTGSPITMGLTNSLPAGSWNIRIRGQYVGSFGASVQVELLNASDTVVGTTVAEPLNTTIDTHLLAIETTGTATKIRISAV